MPGRLRSQLIEAVNVTQFNILRKCFYGNLEHAPHHGEDLYERHNDWRCGIYEVPPVIQFMSDWSLGKGLPTGNGKVCNEWDRRHTATGNGRN